MTVHDVINPHDRRQCATTQTGDAFDSELSIRIRIIAGFDFQVMP